MILTSRVLSQLDWIEHGFGTRHSSIDQDQMASLKQIHSNLPLVADRHTGCVGEGDALMTNLPGVAVSVRTADCFPILLADPRTRAVAAVHAGWRGTADHVVVEALTRMRTEYGTNPAEVYAAIGPGIGKCCYEVGIEVARRFGLDQPGNIDLAVENRRQLLAAGVREDRIDVLAFCTFCEPGNFFSWRRDHEPSGRMISYIRARG
jgi:YfiH family protein